MRLLQERDSSDSELLVYAVTLINKTLHGLPDQDSYYDQIENLEALGMQQIVTRYNMVFIHLHGRFHKTKCSIFKGLCRNRKVMQI
jgi:hypothetical protein